MILAGLKFILPETILVAGMLFVLIADLVRRDIKVSVYLSLGACALALFAAGYVGISGEALFSGMAMADLLAFFFKIIFLLIAVAVILLAFHSEEVALNFKAEFYTLFLLATAAMMFLAGAHNLLMIYLGIEFLSIISYVLAAYWRGNLKSSESGLKYFFFGTVCSMTMLYGMSLLYGATGSLNLSEIHGVLCGAFSDQPVIFAAFVLVFIGLAFKIAAVPTHAWCPDIYEGAPTPVTAFFSVGPKLAGFAVLARFLLGDAPLSVYQPWSEFLGVVSILTMTVGNAVALTQTNIKRLMAYSSIAHAGYCLIGLVAGGPLGARGLLIYLITYAAMNLGAFAVIIAVGEKAASYEISDYEGLGVRSPLLAGVFAVFLVSLTGIPPLAGFIGKFSIFGAAIQKGLLTLAIIGVINTAVAAYYYFRILRAMYLMPPKDRHVIALSFPVRCVLIAALLLTLFMGIFPQPIMDLSAAAVLAPPTCIYP